MDRPAQRRMCLYLPFLSTDQVRRARETGAPSLAMVLTQQVGLALSVVRVDPLGLQAGLRAGMSLAQARALCPGLAALPHDPARDEAVLEKLADWAVRFSPLVQPRMPDALLADVTGCEALFGGQERIAALALAGLDEAGFFARAAIADTVGAAFALATTANRPVSIAPPGETTAHIAPLSVGALRLEQQAMVRLEALGIKTVDDLLKLPRAELPSRFGGALNLRLQQALGEVFEGVPVRLPRTVPYARLEFEQPLSDAMALQASASDLLQDVFAQLEQRDQALRRLDVMLLFENRPQRVAIELSRASRRREHVWQLLQPRLEKCDLGDGITGLVLMASDVARSPALQGELFQPDQQPLQAEQLGLLLDRLANRLGRHAVLRADLVDDYQPESAVGYSPACQPDTAPGEDVARTPRGRNRKSRRDSKPVGRATPLRPTQLLPRPLLIRVISQVPDGPPTWFSCRGREYVVRAAWGPERIETAWWRGPDIRRDYFRLETQSGEHFWVYRNFDDQRWYLHGAFA